MATIKITKNDRYNQLLAIAEVAANPELVSFIQHEQELLARKNVTKNGKQTKVQAENAALAEQVYAIMPSDSMLVKELTKAVRENIDLTTQKMTAVLAVLLEQGKVTKEMVKGNPYYTKVED